jgi:hypothetical protein
MRFTACFSQPRSGSKLLQGASERTVNLISYSHDIEHVGKKARMIGEDLIATYDSPVSPPTTMAQSNAE